VSNFAQTPLGPRAYNTSSAMTALSELVLANFSAVFRLMKPKPYESSNDPLHPVCHEGRCSCAPVCADKFRALPDR